MPSPKAVSTKSHLRRICATVPLLLVTAALVSACGSSSPAKTTPKQSGGNGSQTKATQAHAITVKLANVPGFGKVLANAKGAPLFLLTADPSGSSSCTGACATSWPPLKANGKPTAGPGVTASMLSTFARSNGAKQVLYNGHALYTHPGVPVTSAAGTASDGGVWYLVSPSGDAVKATTGSGY